MAGGYKVSYDHIPLTFTEGYLKEVLLIENPFDNPDMYLPVPQSDSGNVRINLSEMLPEKTAHAPEPSHAVVRYQIKTNNDPLTSGGYSLNSRGARTRLYVFDSDDQYRLVSDCSTDDNAKDTNADSGILPIPLQPKGEADDHIIKIRYSMQGTYQTGNYIRLSFVGWKLKYTGV